MNIRVPIVALLITLMSFLGASSANAQTRTTVSVRTTHGRHHYYHHPRHRAVVVREHTTVYHHRRPMYRRPMHRRPMYRRPMHHRGHVTRTTTTTVERNR